MQQKRIILDQTKELRWNKTRRWAERDLKEISRIIIHQELGSAPVKAVNAYHLGPNHISPRGCPHFCYHYGIEADGTIIKANELHHVTWHTNGENREGVGIMLVGNFEGPGNAKGKDIPGKEQLESLEMLTGFLQEMLEIGNQDIYGHCHFGKPSCPGRIIQEWIETKQRTQGNDKWKGNLQPEVKEIQGRLLYLGYDCGEADNIPGTRTRNAIRQFQKDHHLKVDGVAGMATYKAILLKTPG